MLKKMLAIFGSNCFADSLSISNKASVSESVSRYGRSDVIASKASATASILAIKGISSPFKFRG